MGLFALFFIIVLSATLVAGSFLIWKSRLPDKEKMIGIITILALFCIVTIVNEAKKSASIEPRFSVAEFESSFFHSPAKDLKPEYDLPLIQDYKNFILSSFEKWDPEDMQSIQLALLYHEGRVGKTFSVQMYTDYLQQHKIPTLYVSLKNPQTDVFTFAGILKIANLNVLDEVIQRFNDNGKIPIIFIDNIHNAFEKETCSLCTYLKGLYDNKQVNIILITNDVRARENLQTSTNSHIA
jgi:Cdc6-related protein, AAA superfamily ATPase